MEEVIPHWKQAQLEAEQKRAEQKSYPELGKIVKFSGEYGVVIFTEDYKGDTSMHPIEALCVRWDTPKEFDSEQFGFFDYEYIDEYEFKYINMDGTLKDEFKNHKTKSKK